MLIRRVGRISWRPFPPQIFLSTKEDKELSVAHFLQSENHPTPSSPPTASGRFRRPVIDIFFDGSISACRTETESEAVATTVAECVMNERLEMTRVSITGRI